MAMVQLAERVELMDEKAMKSAFELNQKINLRQSYEVEKVTQGNAVFKSSQGRFRQELEDRRSSLTRKDPFVSESFNRQENLCDKSPKKSWFQGQSGTQALLGPGSYM